MATKLFFLLHIGVNINTASPSLLKRGSGLSAQTAKNIVTFREENGAFSSRKELLKVKAKRLCPKCNNAVAEDAVFCSVCGEKLIFTEEENA